MTLSIVKIDTLAPPFDLEDDPTYWSNFYKILAEEFDATISDRPNEISHLYTALLTLIDLRSDNFGEEAEVDLLMQMNLLYLQARSHFAYDPWRNNMITAINDFTIQYFGDLTVFVNILVPWDDGCVPFYWAQLSENNRISTEGWNICNIS